MQNVGDVVLGWFVWMVSVLQRVKRAKMKSFTGLSNTFMSADVTDMGLLCCVTGKMVDF